MVQTYTLKVNDDFLHLSSPWLIYDVSRDYKAFGVYEIRAYSEYFDEEDVIATIWANDVDIEEKLASLHLISKAPDILDLLVLAEERLEKIGDAKDKELLEQIDNLLKKLLFNSIEVYREETDT